VKLDRSRCQTHVELMVLRSRFIGLVAIGVLALGLVVAATATERRLAGGAHTRCSHGWNAVPVPGRRGALSGVAAASPDDVWAVGSELMEHWDGTRWQRVPVPANEYLNAITALAPDDAWAVGDTGDPVRMALIARWDGRSWKRLPLSRSASKSVGRMGRRASRFLVAVSASAPDDVWAVGYDSRHVTNAQVAANNYVRPLDAGVVLHWDGTAWMQVPTPIGVLRDVEPTGVVAISVRNVWIIANGVLKAYDLAMHWDGRRWRVFRLRGPVPADRGGSLTLHSLTAVSARDIRVAATADAPGEAVDNNTWGLIFRWNGHRWIRRIPEGRLSLKSYDAIVARTPTQVWVAANDANVFALQAGAEFFITGKSPKKSMRQQLNDGYIIEALTSDKHTVWAVGWIGSGRGNSNDNSYAHARPLIELYGC
jgi:hypothetical protein